MKIKNCILGLLFLASCTPQEQVITDKKWKYQDGFYIGDVVYFDTTNYYKLESVDKIYKEGIFVAEIESVGKKQMRIKSKENQFGTYISF